jgi:transposase
MLGFSFAARIFLCTHPADMRKTFDGLVGLVTNQLRQDPIKDGAFVLVNKRRDRMEALVWGLGPAWLLVFQHWRRGVFFF